MGQGIDTKTAVILAGGKGTRLRPYTTSFPKPLMPVGDRPVLEILIEQLIRDGFTHFHFAVGHLAELIEAYFGDGHRWGESITISYSREESPLGTAGPLAMLAESLPEQFLVVNGDVLTDLDYGAFLDSHRRNDPARVLTISTHKRILCSEYGVLNATPDGLVRDYSEKPSYHLSVSEGVYAFSHETLSWIPKNQRFDFPDLVQRMMREHLPVVACEHNGMWLDIGRPDDYEEAQRLVAEHPERFLTRSSTARERTRQHDDVTQPYRIQMADTYRRS
jgi:NDP-sugar pyrophosphorylase family protein